MGGKARRFQVVLATVVTVASCLASAMAPVAAAGPASGDASRTVSRGGCSGTALAPVVYLSQGRYWGYARFRASCTSTRSVQFETRLMEQDPDSNPDDSFVNNGFGGSWSMTPGRVLTLKSPTVRCNTEVGPEELYSLGRFRYRSSTGAWLYSSWDIGAAGSFHCG